MSLWDRPNGPQGPAANSAAMPSLNVQGQGSSQLPCLTTITVTSATVIPNPQQSTLPLLCPLRPDTGVEQTLFNVVVSGYIKTTASGTITLTLYSGTSLTVGSDTSLGASSAVTQNTATAPFAVKAELIYDSISGKLTGTIRFLINNVLTAEAAIANVVTGVSNTSNPVLNFLLAITSSGAGTGTPTTINIQKFNCG